MINEEYDIKSFYSGRLIGKWRVYQGKLQFKENGKYDYKNCINITDEYYYDEYRAKRKKISEVFSNYYVYQCKENQAIMIFNKNNEEDKKVIKYSPSISSNDITAIMTNISLRR